MPAEKILVVEDTQLLQHMYRDRLVADGFNVDVASDGLEALNILRTDTMDLMVLDLIMPRMGGLEVLETVRNDPRLKDLPVLVLTNLGEETAIQHALELGAIDYLIKNSSKPADVSAKIRLTLDSFGPTHANHSLKLKVKDREGDADLLVTQARLPRRFWCPACETELSLELIPNAQKPGWYDSHFVCDSCGRDF